MCLGNTSSVRKDWHEAKCTIYHNTLDSIYFFCIESDHDLSLNLIKYCQSLNYNTGKQGNIVGQITQSGIEHFIFLQFGQRLHTMFCYTESDKQQPGVMDRYSRGMPNKVTRSRLFADNQLWILAVVNLCLVFAFFFFFFYLSWPNLCCHEPLSVPAIFEKLTGRWSTPPDPSINPTNPLLFFILLWMVHLSPLTFLV